MIRVLASTLALSLLALSAFAAAFQAPVIAITDGDTIKVLEDGHPVRIRLAGIDCPEKKQPFGTRAKQFTSDMVFGQTVEIEPQGLDRYGRTIAVIISQDGQNLNQQLVKAGLAWWYVRYAPHDETLAAYQGEAQQAHRGLWADPNPIAPWDWRKGER